MMKSRNVAVAGLLCAVLAGCGTEKAGSAAGEGRPSSPTSLAAEKQPCPPDETTQDGSSGGGVDETSEEASAQATAPGIDETTDETSGPGVDETTDDGAGSSEPPTDEITDEGSGSAEPPTDEDTGTPGPPTDETTDDDAGDAGPPTEGTAPPCLPAGWFDMTQEFTDYYAKHLTKADDGMWPFLVAARLRQEGESVKALVTVNFIPSGGSDYEGRRIAEVFAAWRHEAYGDKGKLRIETRSGGEVVEQAW
ncbi:hypothetical protein [Streptomyces melanogenes]|uniref:Lipoprotein n=1 Tax=Streptomyces melanogenes TaxID=67326 RepID=A0ABZ1XK22_9ACTN|nr:hypothetical protein [Streptomyces melanogenes]